MKNPIRVLLAGDGHGALAVLEGLSLGGFNVSLCTGDVSLSANAKIGIPCYNSLQKALDERYDIVVAAGYKPIIPLQTVQERTILNVHYSLLPQYRGMHSVVWAMLNGEEKVGFTVHEMDELIDHGAIVFQQAIGVEDKTSTRIMEELNALVREKIAEIVRSYIQKKIIPQPQDDSEATFVGKRNLDDCKIDWNWSSSYMDRVLRTLAEPYPLPFFEYSGQRWEVVEAESVHRHYHEIPGHVVYLDRESAWIKLKDGLLRVYRVRRDGQIYQASALFKQVGARLP